MHASPSALLAHETAFSLFVFICVFLCSMKANGKKQRKELNLLFCNSDNASRNADEELLVVAGDMNKLGKEGHKVDQLSFHELLEKELCRCSQEKIFCHNVHLPNLHAFPEDIQFL